MKIKSLSIFSRRDMRSTLLLLLFVLLILLSLLLYVSQSYLYPYPSFEGFESQSPGKTYIFYHIYCGNTTYPILREQVYKIVYSGLYKRVDTIYCFLTGEEDSIQQCRHFLEKSGTKFVIAKVGVNDTTYERFTLESIPSYIKPEDIFLYIHTKGVGKSDREPILDWRNNMEYYLFYHHEKCLDLLKKYDTVGIDFKTKPKPHYSGNFWWTRASYYLSLPRKIGPDYYDPEMYLMLKNPKYYIFYDSEFIKNPNEENNRHEFEEYGMKYYIDLKE